MDRPDREKINTLLKFHEARLEDIKREERTTEGYIIGEESNRNKTIDQILAFFPDMEGLKEQIDIKQDDAFVESAFGSLEHQMQMQAMMSAYDVCLRLIADSVK